MLLVKQGGFTMPKQYKEEFKKQAVAYYEQCHSLCMMAEKYQVAASTVNWWVNEHKNLGNAEESFTLSEFRTLKRKYERTLHLIEIIRLTGFLDEVDLQKKLIIIVMGFLDVTHNTKCPILFFHHCVPSFLYLNIFSLLLYGPMKDIKLYPFSSPTRIIYSIR